MVSIAINGFFDALTALIPYDLWLTLQRVPYALNFSFQKFGKSATLLLLHFVPYRRVTIDFIVKHTYSFVDIKIERRLRSGKNASIKEAIVLDAEADLIPVTLICNHEVEATELCHIYHVPLFFSSFVAWFLL